MSGYFFDKRKRKRSTLKYLVIFLIAFVPVVLFNIYILKGLENWLVILIDTSIILLFVLVGNIIANRFFEKKDAKLEAKIREREKMQEKKNLILEQSYKAKRNKKLEEKKAKEEAKDGGKADSKEDK